MFCGQIVALEADEEWQQETLNELATELCDCDRAKHYTFTKKRKERARKCIDEQFKKEIAKNGNILCLLMAVTDMVINEEINSISCDIDERVKAKISITAKGNVKIERTEKNKEANEA